MSPLEPECQYCHYYTNYRCRSDEEAAGCAYNTRRKAAIYEVVSEISPSLDTDFGFTFADDAPLELPEDDRAQRLFDKISTLLDNLSANPDNPVIKWPNRAAKIAEFRSELRAILEGRE